MVATILTAAQRVLGLMRDLDVELARATVEQARQAVLANERRREPLAGGLDLEVSEFVAAGGPVHRHVRTG